MENKDNKLITYTAINGLGGGEIVYSISKTGKMKITESTMGKTTSTKEFQLTETELEAFNNFINNELVGKEYESLIIMDASFVIEAAGREFKNVEELTDKLTKLLSKVENNHKE